MVRCLFCGIAAVLCATATAYAAESKGKTYDEPKAAQADPDFAVQGEYTGDLRTDEGPRKVGVQVIALGGGKFHSVFYRGGLPGDGWDKEHKREGNGETKDSVTTLRGERGSARIKQGVMTLANNEGEEVG